MPWFVANKPKQFYGYAQESEQFGKPYNRFVLGDEVIFVSFFRMIDSLWFDEKRHIAERKYLRGRALWEGSWHFVAAGMPDRRSNALMKPQGWIVLESRKNSLDSKSTVSHFSWAGRSWDDSKWHELNHFWLTVWTNLWDDSVILLEELGNNQIRSSFALIGKFYVPGPYWIN